MPPFFALAISLRLGPPFTSGPAWTEILVFGLLHVGEMMGAYYHAQPLAEMGSQTFCLGSP
jgi:hypothetical protein